MNQHHIFEYLQLHYFELIHRQVVQDNYEMRCLNNQYRQLLCSYQLFQRLFSGIMQCDQLEHQRLIDRVQTSQ